MKYFETKLNKVYLGDCLDITPDVVDEKSVDLVFTDLPYGTTRAKWDTPLDLNVLWHQYRKIMKPNTAFLLWAQLPFDKVLGNSNLSWLRYEWIWEKTSGTGHLNARKRPLKCHENLLVFYKKFPKYYPQKTFGHAPVNSYTKYVATQNNTEIYGKMNIELSGGGNTDRYPRSVLKYPSDKQRTRLSGVLHPNQKSLEFTKKMILTYTDEGDLVLDSCAGSGTIAAACEELNRRCISIEKEEKWLKVIVKRLSSRLN